MRVALKDSSSLSSAVNSTLLSVRSDQEKKHHTHQQLTKRGLCYYSFVCLAMFSAAWPRGGDCRLILDIIIVCLFDVVIDTLRLLLVPRAQMDTRTGQTWFSVGKSWEISATANQRTKQALPSERMNRAQKILRISILICVFSPTLDTSPTFETIPPGLPRNAIYTRIFHGNR